MKHDTAFDFVAFKNVLVTSSFYKMLFEVLLQIYFIYTKSF